MTEITKIFEKNSSGADYSFRSLISELEFFKKIIRLPLYISNIMRRGGKILAI